MSRGKTMTLGLTLLALGGCNVVPIVQYRMIDDNHKPTNITDSFYLAKSEVTISVAVTEDEKKVTEEYSVVSKPKAYEGFKVGISPSNSMRVSTKVNITKIDNTDLVSSVGIETTDNTATMIGQVGGIIVKVLSFATSAAAPAKAPTKATSPCIGPKEAVKVTLEPSYLTDRGTISNLPSAAGLKSCITLNIGPAPKDAVDIKEVMGTGTGTGIEWDKDTSNYIYSACRDVTVTIKQAEEIIEKTVRIADPNRIQVVQYPYKGSVTMHSQCGVSVKTDATAPQNGLSVADALVTQAKAIRDAIEASKK